MKKGGLRRLTVTVLAAAYLLVVLFGQLFHTHSRSHTFGDLQFTSQKTLHKEGFSVPDTDCLVCHLLHDTHAVLPDGFACGTISGNHYFTGVPEHQFLYLFKLKEVSTLRGPPVS